MKKQISISSLIIFLVVAIVLTFNITYVLLNVSHNKEMNELISKNKFLSTLLTVDQVVRQNYVGEIDDEELKNSIIRGYLEGIGDNYSQYMTSKEYEDYLSEFGGSAVGIGVNVIYNIKDATIEVIDVIPDSPAESAGIQVGDFIVAVDGTRISDVGYYAAVDLIKGEAGTSVTITVKRGEEESDILCIRAAVAVVTVKCRVHSKYNDIGIIKISSFYSETPNDVKNAVESLKALGCDKFIFDLRNNGGGELNSIIKTLDYLLPEGKLADIYYSTGKAASFKSDASYLDASVAVLVNENTASAAELFAAALRDYTKEGKYNALLVGTTTYGKGVFQSFYTLPDGSAFKFTVGRYDPPCGINYDGDGVAPDVIEDLSDEAKEIGLYKLTDENDNQLIEAAIRLSAK